MRNVWTMAKRILRELRRDKRTLIIMLAAPLLILTLIFWLLDSYSEPQTVALLNAPVAYQQKLEQLDVQVIRCDAIQAEQLLQRERVVAIVELVNDRLTVQVDGSSSSAAQVIHKLEQAKQSEGGWRFRDQMSQLHYVYGRSDLSLFDQMGASLIGILIFFLVFLVAGISFVQERTSGTLEKLLSTPIRRWQIVLGYVLGFGVVAVLQSVLLALYVVCVLHVMLVGSIWLVLLLTLLSAITALTLSILLSTMAASAFQMVQFIPVVILPQIFLSGLFPLSGVWQFFSYLTPVYYIADGLKQVMLRGAGFGQVLLNVGCLIGFSVLFFILNVMLLKKQRQV